MNIKPLLEEFEEYIPRSRDPIFFFPLREKEIRELLKGRSNRCRFIADPVAKKIYIFSATNNVHYDVYGWKKIPDQSSALSGVADYINGKFYYSSSDVNNFRMKNLKDFDYKAWYKMMTSVDWSFVDKYIEGTSSKVKRELRK
jgi:hypothetical protein